MRLPKSSATALTAVAALVLAPLGTQAATSTKAIAVTATVAAACNIATTPMAFGAYDPLSGADKDATGTFTVTCTKGTSYQHKLSSTLAMAGATNGGSLAYALYTDAPRTTAWTLDTLSASILGTGTAQAAVTVYGRIPASQNVAPDDYAGDITVTVNF